MILTATAAYWMDMEDFVAVPKRGPQFSFRKGK